MLAAIAIAGLVVVVAVVVALMGFAVWGVVTFIRNFSRSI